MNRILKGGFYATGGLVTLIALSLGGVYGVSQSHLDRTYDVQPAPLVLPTDAETIDHGRHTAVIRGCVDCHGDDLGGKVFVEDPAFGRLIASNLTAGRGGIGETYAVEDYDRAIRHGIGPDGKALLFMPSHEFNRMSDEDTAALIAYLRSVPPVDSDFPSNRVGPIARALYLKGDLPLLPAELIDHADLTRSAPERGPTAAYGGYLATGCIGCHGAGLSGGAIPGAPPDFPPAANITPHPDGLAGWTEEGFITAMRTGVRPDGTELRDPYMPWPLYAQMTDDEIRALWAYLQTVEARPYGQR